MEWNYFLPSDGLCTMDYIITFSDERSLEKYSSREGLIVIHGLHSCPVQTQRKMFALRRHSYYLILNYLLTAILNVALEQLHYFLRI